MLKGWLRTLLQGKGKGDIAHKLKPFLKDERSRAVLRLVLENPGIGVDALALRSLLDRDVVEGYVNGFIAGGLVVPEKEGESTGYHIADAAKAAVVEHLPLNYQCPGLMRE